MYADVIIEITNEKLDKIFQYSIPMQLEGMLKVGLEVRVPFGHGNRKIKGYVIGLSETTTYDPSKIKEIIEVVSVSVNIEAKLVILAAWMKEYYGGTMIQALKMVLPVKQKENEKKQRTILLLLDEIQGKKQLELYLHKNQKARARVLAVLLDEPELEYEILAQKAQVPLSVIKSLESQGILGIQEMQVFRNPIPDYMGEIEQKEQITYSLEQEHAIAEFCRNYDNNIQQTYLIHGVTGSGKTEVYIEMIAHAIKAGKQAIVLIPEIALTYQTVQRFYKRFGNRVSILNSKMSKGERYDQWVRAKQGDIDVIIGPRSAVFTPFSQLGVIIIDEEHEQSYKSEQVPRYHARETAIERARIEGASVILGSATPSMEAFYKAQQGEYQLLTMCNRSMKQAMPSVYTVDLRKELENGNRSIISKQLQRLIEDRLQKHEQIMLFLNRRGYAGFLACRSCGYVAKCPHCDISLSEHQGNRLVCHYCGYTEAKQSVCPQCGSQHFGGFRAGTQQIQEIVERTFPGIRTLRMDLDTTRAKNGYEKILRTFAKGEADVLIGTQMIVKGHDFPNVTLVGVLAADLSLYANDYRAGERTFQLLTQAAGRAGRGEKAGEVVIQTYNPEHYSIQTASKQEYLQFYQEEFAYRDLMGYPPVEHIMAILMQSLDELILEEGAKYTGEFIQRINRKQEVQIIGPTTPTVGKVNDQYRKVIYVKSEKYGILISIKNKLEQYIEMNKGFQKIRIQFDFDPMNIW